MILRWKIEDIRRKQLAIEVWFPKTYLIASAPRYIVLVHFGKALLEFERNTFTHDADAVNGINECLRIGVEEITYQNPLDHLRLLYTRKNKWPSIVKANVGAIRATARLACSHDT